MDELKRFLIQNVPDINATNEIGCTALWFAAKDGNVECVTVLLDTKADANKADDMGVAPLHKASSAGSVECVRILMQHKANVNALDGSGSLPLHYASANGRLACTQILITSNTLCERDKPNANGTTPLAYAIMFQHSAVAEFLVHSGAKMSNVKSSIRIPDWMNQLVSKRKSAILSTFTLKGILRKRFTVSGAEASFLKGRIPKDIVNLIGLYVWSTRLDPAWGGSSEDDLKKMKK